MRDTQDNAHYKGPRGPARYEPPWMVGRLAVRPPPAALPAGIGYFAWDDNGGTPYASNGRAWLKVAAALSAAPNAHKDTHKSGGSDALTATDLLEALVKRIRESGGADLLIGSIADGKLTRRSGTSFVGGIAEADVVLRTGAVAFTADQPFGGFKATNLADPAAAQDAATKAYVDALIRGFDWKESVRAASTANLTLSGEQTIDGVAVVASERVLAKNQTAGAENGIYVCAAGAWSRSVDADSSAEVTTGLAVLVSEGTANADKLYILTTNDPITLGTTALTFGALSGGSGEVNDGANVGGAGTGVYDGKTGVTLNFRKLNPASAKITVALNGQQIDLDVPDASTTAKGVAELATDGESAAGVVVQGNDSRLSNARTPTAHTHVASDIASGTLAHERGGLEADVSAGDGYVQIKAGATTVIKTQHAAAAAPGVGDDSADGFVIGSRWIDTTNDKEYVALDVTVGAAVWKETTAAGAADNLGNHTATQDLDLADFDINKAGYVELKQQSSDPATPAANYHRIFVPNAKPLSLSRRHPADFVIPLFPTPLEHLYFEEHFQENALRGSPGSNGGNFVRSDLGGVLKLEGNPHRYSMHNEGTGDQGPLHKDNKPAMYLRFKWVENGSGASDYAYFGMLNQTSVNATPDGAIVLRKAGSTMQTYVYCGNNGTETGLSLGTLNVSQWYDLLMVCTGSAVDVYLDWVKIGTISTDIPSDRLTWGGRRAGGCDDLHIDGYALWQDN